MFCAPSLIVAEEFNCSPTRRFARASSGIVGAVMAKAGAGSLIGAGIWKTVLFIFVSPLLGFLLGSLMMVLVSWAFRRSRPSKVDRWFRRLPLVSAGAYAPGPARHDPPNTTRPPWTAPAPPPYPAASPCHRGGQRLSTARCRRPRCSRTGRCRAACLRTWLSPCGRQSRHSRSPSSRR